MSKNIVIQEGGQGKQLTVDKLKTDLVGGGSCLWVPEDGTTLGTKHINADGTYKASSDGLYGYSEVTVSGVGKATGTDSDGDEAYSYRDPATGRLVTSKLPTSIVVNPPPADTEYTSGETIDFTGMVVKAYLQSGGLWTDSGHPQGVIAFSELELPEQQADASKARSSVATSNLVDYPVPFGNSFVFTNDSTWYEWDIHTRHEISGNGVFIVWTNFENRMERIFCSDTPGATCVEHWRSEDINRNTGEIRRREGAYDPTVATKEYTYGGKTVYYVEANMLFYNNIVEPDVLSVSPTKEAAWTAVYGTISAGGQDIPVKWTRPNGDVLETSFRITVVPSN